MSLPSKTQLEEQLRREEDQIDRLERARGHFLATWDKLEREQADTILSLRQYMDKVKMRDVLENIHSIKE